MNAVANLTDADESLRQFAARFPPEERTLPRMLARQAALSPDRVLVRAGDVAWTFARAFEIAGGMAARLADANVKPGDRVAMLCGNGPAILRAYLGCAFAGAIAVPINIASRGTQLEHILRNCGARLVVADAEWVPQLLATQGCGAPFSHLWIAGECDLEIPKAFTAAALPEPGAPVSAHTSRPGDTVAILYTSGTTGPSKGVCCPQAQYFWWAAHTAALLGLSEGERLLTTLPLFHTNALNTFYQAILTGSTLIVEKRFSVSDFLPSLRRHDATATYLLGAMVPMLLSRPESPEERAHGVRVALAPGVPAEHHEAFTRRFGVAIIDGYGSTETNFVIGDRPREQRPGTMGRLRPGFDAAVVDVEDNALPDGEAGELALRPHEPFAFATGYFAMEDKTVEAWRNFWFHTGDRVVREGDGRFRFLDRMKDAIRRRGENISSYEVEQVLLAHPAVAQAAVFPVRSELAEDEVMAAIVLRAGAALTPIELLDYSAPRLPYFAVPRYLDFVAALPATENGKVQKFKLRAQGVKATSFDAVAAGYKVKR
jgi:crotonobetaine/carnitine-CoA ligase